MNKDVKKKLNFDNLGFLNEIEIIKTTTNRGTVLKYKLFLVILR